jgi:hypothetical protein
MASSRPGRTHKADKRKRRTERNLEDHKLESLKAQVHKKIHEKPATNRAA